MRSDRNTVWFMTENPDKFREAESILASQGIKIQHLKRTKVEVQDPSLEKIARFAVKSAPSHPPGLLVVEDSGLFIDALGGFPGPFSSYVYNTIGLKGILSLMRNQRKRNAYFQTSIAVASTNVPPRVFTGTVRGSVSREIRGTAGFGYDPIFIPEGFRETFGQTKAEFKNETSHRARAFLKFANWYNQSRTRRHRVRTHKRALK